MSSEGAEGRTGRGGGGGTGASETGTGVVGIGADDEGTPTPRLLEAWRVILTLETGDRGNVHCPEVLIYLFEINNE